MRTIVSEWEEFRDECIGGAVPAFLVDALRQSFYAGAFAFYYTAMENQADGTLPESGKKSGFEALCEEVVRLAKTEVAKHG